MSNHNLEAIFNTHNWDIEEPLVGHEKRFSEKLNAFKPKKKKNYWIAIGIAASFLLGISILYFTSLSQEKEVVFSPQVQETHDYFSSILTVEVSNLKKLENPATKMMIEDALLEMERLEKDYESLKIEIRKNGENKQIVFAMITNMQTRISFIKQVLEQVEQLNSQSNENNT
jgi:uncharacterized protein YsxB (DUF464 family)